MGVDYWSYLTASSDPAPPYAATDSRLWKAPSLSIYPLSLPRAECPIIHSTLSKPSSSIIKPCPLDSVMSSSVLYHCFCSVSCRSLKRCQTKNLDRGSDMSTTLTFPASSRVLSLMLSDPLCLVSLSRSQPLNCSVHFQILL
ncbi:Uncharacterized protein HZ326_1597 [Fusarium oxysporum f. sp. albedinis]|nr:Uncharacterized protein HZ326_1597 [Fusarium oxysporum f. sp. albedinis]